MNNKFSSLLVFTLSALLFPLAAPQPSVGALANNGSQQQAPQQQLLLARRQCRYQAGPFNSYGQAQYWQRTARNYGYGTSGIWGSGGLYSRSTNRRYFFNVFYRC